MLFYFLPLLFFILFLYKFFTHATHKNLPPSPPKVPILGNLHQLGLVPHRSLQLLSQKYGPLMLLHFGNKPTFVVSSASAAREILETHDINFSTRPRTSIASRLHYDSKDIAFSPYGEYWRQVRSICVLNLLSNKRVQSFRSVREEETAIMIDRISSSPKSVNLTDIFGSLTNNIACRVALGKKYDGTEEGMRIKEILVSQVELVGSFNVGDFIPWLSWVNRFNGLNAKVEKTVKGMDKFLEGVVEEHMDQNRREKRESGSLESEGRMNFVDILLEVQRENKGVQRDTIKALLLDMFGAGSDTIFATLVWAVTELLRHPQSLKKLQDEVRQVARGKQKVTEDDLDKMHYMKAVIKEVLRVHIPTPLLPRESIQDIKIMGYNIPAGTQVIVNAWAIARDPSSWEDPNEFRPERFLNSSLDIYGRNLEFIPFGAGRRSCPGNIFAMNVAELALASLVHRFDFSMPGGASGMDLDMSETSGVAIHKKTPLIVVATPYSG